MIPILTGDSGRAVFEWSQSWAVGIFPQTWQTSGYVTSGGSLFLGEAGFLDYVQPTRCA